MQNVFPLFYAGNIQYFSELKKFDEICFETHEFFEKQTFRNRCMISTANGIQQLVIPVVRDGKTPIKDVRISYTDHWQKDHWRALTSAYKNSPFFEFYEDYFKIFYIDNQIDTLVEFNSKLFELIISKLHLEISFNNSDKFIEVTDVKFDYRKKFPKKNYIEFQNKKHYQVFDDRFPFQNNLSIFDLLFNLGPEAKLFL